MISSDSKSFLPSAGPAANAEPQAAPGPRSRGILVVDDAACVRNVLGQMLWEEGFTVWVAADGMQALELYREHHDTIDLVLLDQAMPRLDGLQTLDSLRKLDPLVHCCFLTADTDNGAELIRRGAMRVLQKPLGPREVIQVVRGLLDETAIQ